MHISVKIRYIKFNMGLSFFSSSFSTFRISINANTNYSLNVGWSVKKVEYMSVQWE